MRGRIAGWLAFSGCCVVLVATFIAVVPIITTVPSERARQRWEKDYSSLLPRNYSDFQAHWQSQDVGVRIFSFKCPLDLTGDQVLQQLVDRLPAFETVGRAVNEVVVRRPITYSGEPGFDEYRFVYRPKRHRVYGLFANLDSETAAHGELLRKLRDVAGPP
jgi:hypothetical protein